MTTSSPSPKRSERFAGRLRRARTALRAAGAAMVIGATPSAPVAVPLPVEAVFVDGSQASVVVDLSAGTRPGPRSAEATTDGLPRRVDLVPLMSAGLAVTIVVDSSAAGAAALPAWLSAGARFVLEGPAGTRATVIGDSAPAATIAPPQDNPVAVVAALQGVRPHGDRDTAAALALAARQFPDVPAGRKLTVVYTGATDAGGPSATAVAEQFGRAGVILVVAAAADASLFWSSATEPTGGFLAPAGRPVVAPALDQVQTTLGGRYLVQFPTPARRPAAVPLRVTTPDLTLAADVTVPAPAVARSPGRPHRAMAPAAVIVVVLVLGVAWLLVRRARVRRRPPPIVIAHGRATVPTTPPPREGTE